MTGGEIPSEVMNKKAVSIINRVRDKLTGRDFDTDEQPVDVRRQVDLLIRSATAHENLCQLYIGWSVGLPPCLTWVSLPLQTCL